MADNPTKNCQSSLIYLSSYPSIRLSLELYQNLCSTNLGTLYAEHVAFYFMADIQFDRVWSL